MKKRLLALTLSVLLVLPVLAGVCAIKEKEKVLNAEDTQIIFAAYPQELALVEELCGHPIDEISTSTRKEIASVANHYLYNRDYRFSALMTDIALASAQQDGKG